MPVPADKIPLRRDEQTSLKMILKKTTSLRRVCFFVGLFYKVRIAVYSALKRFNEYLFNAKKISDNYMLYIKRPNHAIITPLSPHNFIWGM